MVDEKTGDTGVAYVFGPFRLVPGDCLLLRDGQPVALTPRAFDLLRLLVESAGHLKSREELIDALWPTTVVEDNSLPWNMSAVRKALGDSSDAPRYIETVPRRGYRFIAPVEVRHASGPHNDESHRYWPWVAMGALVAIAVVAGVLITSWTGISGNLRTQDVVPRRASIAVLPFKNLNVGKKKAYFVAGIRDLILTKLADIGSLKVISRTSTSDYMSHPDDLRTIAHQLGVTTILEGSVQKTGNQVLVNVQLIDARSGNHIWAKSYQRTLQNVFGVEGEVAQKIAMALNARLSSAESKRLAMTLSADPEANDLFLRAEYLTSHGYIDHDFDSLRRAISRYKQAITQAPDFALAWARLSFSESLLAWVSAENVKTLEAHARADARHALSLAPDLVAAHLALGYSDFWGRGNFTDALKSFSTALALRPGDARALAARGYIERREGKFKAAIASLKQAFTLDPRNSDLAYKLGQTYLAVYRYTDAERAFQRALAVDPNDLMAKRAYARAILYASGDIPRALAAARGDAPLLKLQRVDFLTDARRYREALALLDNVPDTPDNFPPYSLPKSELQGYLYLQLGDTARGQRLEEKALARSRAQLTKQHGLMLASVWQDVADEEIHLGRVAAGLRAVSRARSIFSKSGDRFVRLGYLVADAGLYASAGRADLAVPLLDSALGKPGVGPPYSPVMLWVDPLWDPIRHDPRFQALLKKYAKYKPTAGTTTAAASTVRND